MSSDQGRVEDFIDILISRAKYGIRGEKPIAIIAILKYLKDKNMPGTSLLQLIKNPLVRKHFSLLANQYGKISTGSWSVITGKNRELQRAIEAEEIDEIFTKLNQNQISNLFEKYFQILKQTKRESSEKPELPHQSEPSVRREKELSTEVIKPDREFWVQGNPATFSTGGERPWKETLNKTLPEPSLDLQERGLILEFNLADLMPQGQPLDVDNLCEPVFSILINGKGWFNGKRPNLHWWRASKQQRTPTGCRIKLASTSPPSIQIPQHLIFDDYFTGSLPRSARDPTMPKWICDRMRNTRIRKDSSYFVRLIFDNTRLNIGEIATGEVKSTIDCLYPVIGGTAGNPEDWRIEAVQIEKGGEYNANKGLHISIWSTLI